MGVTCTIESEQGVKHIVDGKVLLETPHWLEKIGPHGGHLVINTETGKAHYGAAPHGTHLHSEQPPTKQIKAKQGPMLVQYGSFNEKPPRTKKEISKDIAEKTGIHQTKVKKIMQHTLQGIKQSLLDHGKVELRGFGVLKLKVRPGRWRQNPRTLEKVYVPERYIVHFTPSKEMQEDLSNLGEEQGLRYGE